MKILVATRDTQGERPDDFFFAQECEIVMLDDCDELHPGCSCKRSMVGAESGKGTTTMLVIESDLTRAGFIERIRKANSIAGFDELVSESIFEAEADELLKLAAQFPAGAIVERNGDDFTVRT